MKANLNPITGTASATIETRCAALSFKITSDSNNYTAFETAIAATTIEVVKQTSGGTIQILPTRLLKDLLEFSTADPDGLPIFATNDGANTTIVASLDLSDFGAIGLRETEFFKVNIVGLPANNSMDIYAIDAEKTTDVHNVYQYIHANASIPKQVDVRASRWLFLPIATTTKLELVHQDGTLLQYEAEEVKNICLRNNKTTFIENGLTTIGGRNWYAYNVATAVQARVTLSADGVIVKSEYQKL